MSARILLVDDHEIVREGIRTLITRSRPDWEICGEARDGEEALEAVRTLKPDVVILDITMPKMSGLEAAPRIAKLGLGCRVLDVHDARLGQACQRSSSSRGPGPGAEISSRP